MAKELTDKDKEFILQNRTTMSEADMAKKLKIKKNIIEDFIASYVISLEKKASVSDYAGKSGALAATGASASAGDDSEKRHNKLPPKYNDCIHYIGKLAHLNKKDKND